MHGFRLQIEWQMMHEQLTAPEANNILTLTGIEGDTPIESLPSFDEVTIRPAAT